MNKNLFTLTVMLCTCVFFCQPALAQTKLNDDSLQQTALNNAILLYKKKLGVQAPLFTGPEYYLYSPRIKGNAYYQDVSTFTSGSVDYDGILYNNVLMVYDLNTDEVAVQPPGHVVHLKLMRAHVRSFDLLKTHFINFIADTMRAKATVKPGYYAQLYNGKVELLGRYEKSIQTSQNGLNGLEDYFSPTKNFYVKRNNIYTGISSLNALVDVLKDRKKELKQYIRTEKIKYRNNPEEALVKVATYYDHLSN